MSQYNVLLRKIAAKGGRCGGWKRIACTHRVSLWEHIRQYGEAARNASMCDMKVIKRRGTLLSHGMSCLEEPEVIEDLVGEVCASCNPETHCGKNQALDLVFDRENNRYYYRNWGNYKRPNSAVLLYRVPHPMCGDEAEKLMVQKGDWKKWEYCTMYMVSEERPVVTVFIRKAEHAWEPNPQHCSQIGFTVLSVNSVHK